MFFIDDDVNDDIDDSSMFAVYSRLSEIHNRAKVSVSENHLSPFSGNKFPTTCQTKTENFFYTLSKYIETEKLLKLNCLEEIK